MIGAASPRSARDFSQTPNHSPAVGLIQAKLTVTQTGDEFEQHADRLSEQVMRMPEPALQHAPRGGAARPRDLPDQSNRRIETKSVQSGGAGRFAAPPMVNDVLAMSGQPLDPATQAFMEPRFGHDFSRVRVHADPGAAASAAAINARAYTTGHHVVFAAGQYRPGTTDGRRLLAHELAHVTQQDRPGRLLAPVVQRDAPKEDPKVTALKAELTAAYGFSAVTDPQAAKWTPAELEKMKRALARVPAAEREAIKGVELRRVVSTSDQGDVASGLFKQTMDAGTGMRQDRIEIANDAFDNDKDYDAGGTHTNFGGQVVQGAPSEGVLSHEVGHAIEALPHRQAEEARVKAGIASTAAFTTVGKAQDTYNAAVLSSLNVPGWSNVMEKNYMNAILDAQKKLSAITDVMNTFPQTPTAAETKKGATDFAAALPAAKTAIAKRNTARDALPKGSTYAMPVEEAAQDAWLAAAVALVPPLEARAKAQQAEEQAQGAEDATQTTITVSSGQKVKMTNRLAEFVAVVESNSIQIKDVGLGKHVDSHWPNNPEEAYAELYSLAITAPDGIKKFDTKGAVAMYFTSPVGLKASQKVEADKWLASHR